MHDRPEASAWRRAVRGTTTTRGNLHHGVGGSLRLVAFATVSYGEADFGLRRVVH